MKNHWLERARRIEQIKYMSESEQAALKELALMLGPDLDSELFYYFFPMGLTPLDSPSITFSSS